jgi:hypothetical protein
VLCYSLSLITIYSDAAYGYGHSTGTPVTAGQHFWEARLLHDGVSSPNTARHWHPFLTVDKEDRVIKSVTPGG